MAVEIETYLQRFTSLQSKRAPFEPQFNEIAENIFIRKADFTSKLNMIATKGGFLTENLFDLSAMDALDRLSNVLLSDIWDKGVRSFKLNPPEEMQGNLSEELVKFYNLLNIKNVLLFVNIHLQDRFLFCFSHIELAYCACFGNV